MPQVREPYEKELCAGPLVTLGYGDGSSGDGAVLSGGLKLGSPATYAVITTTTTTFTLERQRQVKL